MPAETGTLTTTDSRSEGLGYIMRHNALTRARTLCDRCHVKPASIRVVLHEPLVSLEVLEVCFSCRLDVLASTPLSKLVKGSRL